MLTPEQRDEGLRLLKIAQRITKTKETDAYEPFDEWLREHAPELLADHEEISRAAVKKFAEHLLKHVYSRKGETFIYVYDLLEDAKDEFGVTLNTEPQR